MTAPSEAGRVSLPKLIRLLGETTQAGSRVQSLFVEAGPELASALLRQNLVDRLRLFIAPKMIGNGLRAIGDLGVEKLAESRGICTTLLGKDWGRSAIYGIQTPSPDLKSICLRVL